MSNAEYTLESMVGGTDPVAEVLKATAAHKSVATKKNVTPDAALKAAGAALEDLCIDNVRQDMEGIIEEAYDNHKLFNGEPEELDDSNADDWHSNLDDAIEEAFKPYGSNFSADWLGKNTVGTALNEEGNIAALALSAAKQIYKEVIGKKKPGQLLSAIGITKPDVVAYLSGNTEQAAEDEVFMQCVEVMKRVLATVGTAFDPMEVYDNIDLCHDDDDILASGGAGRLGLTDADLTPLRLFRSHAMNKASDELLAILSNLAENPTCYDDSVADLDAAGVVLPEFVKAALDGVPLGPSGETWFKGDAPEASEAPEVAPATAKPPVASPAAGEVHIGRVIPPEALMLLKQHANVKDVDVGEAIGVSRATFNNKVNGKGDPISDPVQIETIRAIALEHCNGLIRAIGLIDGTVTD